MDNSQIAPIIVSLTSIPSRVGFLQSVIDSIRAQTVQPENIELYLPRVYKKRSLGLIDQNISFDHCEVIFTDIDYGPATKLLPAVARHRDTDLAIVYCDDDRIYDELWLERIWRASQEHPNSAIAESGMRLKVDDFRIWRRTHSVRYSIGRLCSLGLWNPRRSIRQSYRGTLDVAEGFGGVLVKPRFFSDKLYDVPDDLAMVDDFWISGMLLSSGVKIVQTESDPKCKGSSPLFSGDSPQALTMDVVDGLSRADLNSRAREYFSSKFGIWK